MGVLAVWLLGPGAAYYLQRPVIRINHYQNLLAPVLATPQSARAWPVYVQAHEAFGDVNNQQVFTRLSPAHLLDSAGCAEMTDYLRRHTPAISLARAAAGMPSLGFAPTDVEDPLLAAANGRLYGYTPTVGAPSAQPDLGSLLLPHLSVLRQTSRMLGFDLIMAVQDRRPEDAISDLVALLGIARHAREVPFAVDDSVALAIVSMTYETVAVALARNPDVLSPDHLRAMREILLSQPSGSLGIRFTADRLALADTLQRVYSESAPMVEGREPSGRLTCTGCEYLESRFLAWGPPQTGADAVDMPGLRMAYRDPGRRAIAKTGELFLRALESEQTVPFAERLPLRRLQIVQALPEPHRRRMLRHPVLALGVSWPDWLWGQSQIAAQHRESGLAIIALHMYRLDSGRFPDHLHQLVPTYLPTLPLDAFTNRPLIYTSDGDAMLLYSVGVDRDDDGGRQAPPGYPPEYRPPSAGQPPAPAFHPLYPADGDWVFWPPQSVK